MNTEYEHPTPSDTEEYEKHFRNKSKCKYCETELSNDENNDYCEECGMLGPDR